MGNYNSCVGKNDKKSGLADLLKPSRVMALAFALILIITLFAAATVSLAGDNQVKLSGDSTAPSGSSRPLPAWEAGGVTVGNYPALADSGIDFSE